MFANLKNKLIEEVKASPSKFQQLANAAQAAVSSSNTNLPSTSPSSANNDKFFSISEEETPENTPIRQNPLLINSQENTPYSNVNGAYTRQRRNSNSSMASDVSFRLPKYNMQTLESLPVDFEMSESEPDESVGVPKLDILSKEQVFDAYRKSLDRLNKYRLRYTDMVRRYKDLENDSSKARSVLVETQEKAMRRINELREQCSLEQNAKAHLEEALRMEIDEMKYKNETYETKLKLLEQNSEQKSENNLNEMKLQEELALRNKAVEELELKLSALTTEITRLKEQDEENCFLLAQTKQAIHAELEAKELQVVKMTQTIKDLQDTVQTSKSREQQLELQIEELSLLRESFKQLQQTKQDIQAKLITTEHLLLEAKEKEKENSKEKSLQIQQNIDKLNKQNQELQAYLDEQNQKNQEMEEQITTLKSDLVNKETHEKSILSELEDLKKELSRKEENESYIEKLKYELEELERENQLHKDNLKNQEEHIANLESTFNTLTSSSLTNLAEDDNKVLLEQEIAEVKEEIKLKEEKFEADKRKIEEDLRVEFAPLVEDIQSMSDQIKNFKTRNVQLEAENQNLQAQLKAASLEKDEIKDLIEKKKNLNDQLESWKEEEQLFKKQLLELEVENKKLQDALKTIETEKMKLQQELDKLQSETFNELELLKEKSLEINEALQEKNKELETTQQQVVDLNVSLKDCQAEVENKTTELEKKTQELEYYQARTNDLKQQLDEISVEKVSLLENVKESEKYSKELKELQETCKCLEQKVKQLNEENLQLESSRKEVTQLSEGKLKELEEKRNQFETLKKSSTELEQKLKKTSKEKLILEKKLKKSEESLKESSANFEKNSQQLNEDKLVLVEQLKESEERLEELETLEKKVKEISEEKLILTTKIENMNGNDDLIQQLNKDNLLLENKVKNLEESLRDVEDLVLQLDGVKQLVKNKIEEIRVLKDMSSAEKDILNEKINNLEEIISSEQQSKSKLQQESSDWEVKFTKLNAEKELLAGKLKELEQLREEIKANQQILQDYKQDNHTHKEELAEVQSQVQLLTASSANLVIEVENLKDEKKLLENEIQLLQEKINENHDFNQSEFKDVNLEVNVNSPSGQDDTILQEIEKIQLNLLESNAKLNQLERNEENHDLIKQIMHLREINQLMSRQLNSFKSTYSAEDLKRDEKEGGAVDMEDKQVLAKNYLELEKKLQAIMEEVQDVTNRNSFLEQQCENYLIMEQSNARLKAQNAKLSRQLDETLVSVHHNETSVTENTEFEYLKNIMFQYLTGSAGGNNETLVKVISAVLRFSPQQQQVALEKEHQRGSLLSKLL